MIKVAYKKDYVKMTVQRGSFKAEIEKPKTAADVKRILAEQAEESKIMNEKFRGSAGITVISEPKQSPATKKMNSFIRGKPEHAESLSQPDLDQAAQDKVKALETAREKRKAAPGGAGSGTRQPIKAAKEISFNESIREVLELRKLLGH